MHFRELASVFSSIAAVLQLVHPGDNQSQIPFHDLLKLGCDAKIHEQLDLSCHERYATHIIIANFHLI